MSTNILNKKILFILIIFGIIIFFGLIFYNYKQFSNQANQELKEQVQDLSKDEQEQQITAPTANMKIYRNEEWGFEFQYPKEWILKENAFESYYSKYNIWIKAPEDKSLYLAFDVNIVLPEFPGRSFSGIEKKISKVIVAGVEGVKYEYEFEGFPETAVILPFREYKMILGTGGDGKQYLNEFNQILSTFKFLK